MKILIAGILTLVAYGSLCSAQDAAPVPAPVPEQPSRFYRLDFVVKELQDGRTLNTRNYFVTVSDRTKPYSRTSIRATSRVNVEVGGGSHNDYQIGVNLDCTNLFSTRENLALDINATVDSLVAPEGAAEAHPVPIVRNNQWSAPVLVQLRKPTIIFSSDDAASKRKLQMELTATPIGQ